MRFSNWLSAWHTPKKGRSPQPINKVPIHEILPLKLKERVSGKFDKAKEEGCLYEMSLVIACLQKTEYEDKLCKKEIEKFNGCYHKFIVNSFNSKRAQEKGILVPGETKFTNKQIRKLFNKHPLV